MISAPPPSGHHRHRPSAPQPLLDVSLASRRGTTSVNFGSPKELVAAMAVLPESAAHALRLLHAHQSCRLHEYIKLCERRHVEEMGAEASSDGEDGSEMAGGE